jgi:hypothetical protein
MHPGSVVEGRATAQEVAGEVTLAGSSNQVVAMASSKRRRISGQKFRRDTLKVYTNGYLLLMNNILVAYVWTNISSKLVFLLVLGYAASACCVRYRLFTVYV